MAEVVKWEVQIRVTSLSTRDCMATGTRTVTDGEVVISTDSVTCEATWPVGMSKGDFLTGVGNTLWQQYQTKAADAAAVAGLVSDCESLLAAGLDAKELE